MSLETLNAELVICLRCPRLVALREKVARDKRRAYRSWDYWGKPVPGFGDPKARAMVVGLAPGAHGSNRTGRMFTGDASGDFLYPALYRFGFASQPASRNCDDGLRLVGLYITAICRCAPPQNRPTPQEIANCQPFLLREIELIQPKVFVALGRIAFENILRMHMKNPDMIKTSGDSQQSRDYHPPFMFRFAHGEVFSLHDSAWLVCSYHPSRQNTQTGRLTAAMFDQIWKTVRMLLERGV